MSNQRKASRCPPSEIDFPLLLHLLCIEAAGWQLAKVMPAARQWIHKNHTGTSMKIWRVPSVRIFFALHCFLLMFDCFVVEIPLFVTFFKRLVAILFNQPPENTGKQLKVDEDLPDTFSLHLFLRICVDGAMKIYNVLSKGFIMDS